MTKIYHAHLYYSTIKKIVVALAETIKLMQLIDAAIPSFPIE
jgi:hypothetical protein